MSIKEFTATLQDRSAKHVLDRLATEATVAYRSNSPHKKAASILNENSKLFGTLGKKQGLSRLVVTEDSLSELLHSFGIIHESPQEAIQLYLDYLSNKVSGYKNKHFEFYSNTGEQIKSTNQNIPLNKYIPTVSGNVTAVRGLNFSHDNTLTHITNFLLYAGAGSLSGLNLNEAKLAVSELYDRGHIIAKTTGRQLASIGGITEELSILDKIVKLSIDLDNASSSLASPKYTILLANIDKDFNDKRMYMNLEFQLKRKETGKGNQDSADITRGLRIISTLRNLIDNVNITKQGRLTSVPIAVNSKVATKILLDLVDKIEKYEQQIISILKDYVEDSTNYVVKLKSSKSILQHIGNSINSTIGDIKIEPTKVSHKNILINTFSTKKEKSTELNKNITSIVNKRKTELKNLVKLKNIRLRNPKGQFESPIKLEALLRARLAGQIEKNMGTGSSTNILNYRTGRFANTASIEKVVMSREGMISVFYSYMKNPYATFSEGGEQQWPRTRDPKLLISKSIREIGSSLVSNRMRAILV